jgi:hypothetical protein
MVAYFLSDGQKAKGSKTSYIHPINIHVDLVYEGLATDYMPLIIDPDIRHPGGSGA